MNTRTPTTAPATDADQESDAADVGDALERAPGSTPAPTATVREIGGRRDGTEPTRFGDWEKNGRCIDF